MLSLIPIRWFDEPHRFGEIIFGEQLNLNLCFFIHGMMVDPGLAFSQAYIESTSGLTELCGRATSRSFGLKIMLPSPPPQQHGVRQYSLSKLLYNINCFSPPNFSSCYRCSNFFRPKNHPLKMMQVYVGQIQIYRVQYL